jgi:hypothetical protein
MAYYLKALIGKKQTLETCASLVGNACIISLGQDMALIPLTREICEELGSSDPIENFYDLSVEIEAWALRISKAGFVAYIEAEVWGGVGDQGALGWNAGSRAFEPLRETDAINRVLKLFGVDCGSAHDEFEAVGLGRHRKT